MRVFWGFSTPALTSGVKSSGHATREKFVDLIKSLWSMGIQTRAPAEVVLVGYGGFWLPSNTFLFKEM